jgi:cytoskeletal protein CcmA (bactofilin family)
MFKKSKIRNSSLVEQVIESLDQDSKIITPLTQTPFQEVPVQDNINSSASAPFIPNSPSASPLNAMSTTPAENLPATGTPYAPAPRSNVMDMLAPANSKPSILSEGFSFRGEINAKGAIHVEGTLNGQIQVNELTIGSKGAVEGVVSCHSLHIKGKFAGTAICNELIVTSSATVDGHVVYQTISVQKGASIKGELLLDK